MSRRHLGEYFVPNLKDCPFCGGFAKLENFVVEASVRCGSCGAKIVRKHAPRKDTGLEQARHDWNRRTA